MKTRDDEYSLFVLLILLSVTEGIALHGYRKEERMTKYDFLKEKYIRLYKILGTSVVVYFLLKKVLPLIVPFLIAWALAGLVAPIAGFLHKKLRIPQAIGGSISLFVCLFLLGMGLFWLVRLLVEQITAFAANYELYENMAVGYAKILCGYCDRTFRMQAGSTYTMLENGISRVSMSVQEEWFPTLTKKSFQAAATVFTGTAGVLVTLIATVLWIKDREEYKESYRQFPFYEELHRIAERLSKTGVAYLKAQGILFLLVAACCSIGLCFIKNEYALLLGLLIAVLDAFPVFGSGLFFIPWALFSLLSGQMLQAAVLITTYVCCLLIRELLEPKLIGDKIGLKPIVMLIAIYVGIQLFGVFGFVLGPFGLILILAVNGREGTESSSV